MKTKIESRLTKNFFKETFKNSAKNVKPVDASSLKRWHYFFLK